MAATTLGFIPLQLIPTNAIGQYNFDKGFPANGTYVVVKTPTVAQQLQLTKSLKEMQNGGKEINNNNNENANKPVLLRCKRRVDFTGLGCKLVDSQSPSVSRRNERERKRVKMVNMGFETLRQHVPVGRKNKKMSKVETLRSAVQYIKQLQEMLEAHDSATENRLLENVDMDELENKVTEMIQNASECNNSLSIKNGLDLSGSVNQEMAAAQNLGNREQATKHYYSEQSSLTPESSPELPHSPSHTQGHFFQNFQNCQQVYTTQFDNVTSSSASGSVISYSQASPAGSLHSPTSSVVSDSSYDSVSHEDDDILSFSSWF